MSDSNSDLKKHIQRLQSRLDESEATVQAIRDGEVDAVVIYHPNGQRVYSLTDGDQSYRLLIESMQQGAATLSSDGTILYCNRSFADMVQKPQESLVGESISNLVSPGEHPCLDDLLATATGLEHPRELSLSRDDGSEMSVAAATGELNSDASRVIFLVLRDLTDEKQHAALKESDRRKDEFLAMLAHELRNPLAPISSAVEMLALSPASSDSSVATACDIIRRQVHQLSRIVGDLLDVSRITRGIVPLQREPQDVCHLVSDAVEASRPLINARNHRLHITLHPDGPRVSGDGARLTQVFTNLLHNAAKYTNEGGDIWVDVDHPNQREVVVRVRDSGIGLSTELLPHIFDMFTQAERSIDRSQGGLGIGLTVVQSLVELHGGRVTAASDGVGTGSEFSVFLPVMEQQTRDEACTDSTSASPSLGRHRVLVVDDNVDAAKSMAMLLKLAGQDACTVHDGQEALNAAAEFQPELVLLDLGLPGLDGFEVARQLRQTKQGGKVVLAAVTGYGDSEDRRRSNEAGFDYHFVKPVDFGALKEVLSKLDEAK